MEIKGKGNNEIEVELNQPLFLKSYEVLSKEDNNNKIVIWPDLPFWLYVNEDTVTFINEINGLSQAEIYERYGYDNVADIVSVLVDSGVLSNDDTEIDRNVMLNVIQYITFNITDSCNLFCKHCYIEASEKKYAFMKLEEAKLIIDKLVPYMIPSCNVIVSGGEALLNPDCVDILKYFNQVGKGLLTLVTNGTTITPNLSNKLKEVNNLTVQVSLDGATKKTHELIRGSGTFERTLKGIRILAEDHHRIYLSPIVTQGLYEEIDDYFFLAERYNVTAIFLQPVISVGRAKENNILRVDDSLVFEKVIEFYEKNPDLKKKIPGSLEVKYLTSIKVLDSCSYCGTGTATLLVQPDGDLYPCPNNIRDNMKIGNVLKGDLKELWFNSPVLQKLRKINVDKNLHIKCRKCAVKRFCGGGCRGAAYQNAGNIYAISPTCEFEKRQRIAMLWCAAEKPELFADEVSRTIEISNQRIAETIDLIETLETDSIL